MSKVLLDTNVLIYALDAQSRYFQSAKRILTEPNYDLFLTTKVISEYFAVCSKMSVPFDLALGFFSELREHAIILFPDNTSLTYFEDLIRTHQPRGNRVFDLEIVSIAIAHQIAQIATANTSDFRLFSEISVLSLEIAE
ncbi:PIN domain-containing protein [Pontibacter sp. G13]|uniref:type II toxin-antitoxin system VapC family toxin n=1 Tax=Pontibacter sp. G13 TaxID=3074898 RepID=UPI0028891E7D|nr:PIN domain-containing protein [Pontibacter sp. G13]WNJ17215.1 PIN domain-containing protein [Pontibacter sp. G13]